MKVSYIKEYKNGSKFFRDTRTFTTESRLSGRLNLIPYDGTPEIKEQGSSKYLYIRKRIAGKLTSTYVDVYSREQ